MGMPPIYCLTMRSTPERHERAMKLFGDLRLPVLFHVAEKDPQGGVFGCWRSHLAIWDRVSDDGEEVAVVFEDDVEVDCGRDELLTLIRQATEAVTSGPFAIVLLHASSVPTGDEPGPVQRGFGVTTCAYVVNVKRLLARGRKALEPSGRHIDFDLLMNRAAPAYASPGVFADAPAVRPGAEFGTVNDYGPLLNRLFAAVGYAPFVDGVGAWAGVLRQLPRGARVLAERANVEFTALFNRGR